MSKKMTITELKQQLKIKYPEMANSITIISDIDEQRKILIQDEFGIVRTSIGHLLEGKKPTICSSLNKTEYFLNKLKSKGVYRNFYDYSDFTYVKNNVKSAIYCRKHNVSFSMTPKNMLLGCMCPECAKENTRNGITKSYKQFLLDLESNNKNAYDALVFYEDTYKNTHTRMKARTKYGDIYVYPMNILSSNSKGYCGIEMAVDKDAYFSSQLKEKYGDRLIYKNTKYLGNNTKTKFCCKEHGDFISTPYLMLSGRGFCQKCSMSSSERATDIFLKKHDIEHTYEERFTGCVGKFQLPFDFYLSKYKICIELDGEQHYKAVRFGCISQEIAEERLKLTQKNDAIKTKYCADNNIKLIRIPYWDFDRIEEILTKELII